MMAVSVISIIWRWGRDRKVLLEVHGERARRLVPVHADCPQSHGAAEDAVLILHQHAGTWLVDTPLQRPIRYSHRRRRDPQDGRRCPGTIRLLMIDQPLYAAARD